MTRAHVEFIQSQQLPWQPSPWPHLAGTRCKLLSRDVATGAATALVNFATGWTHPGYGHLDAAEEFLILEGALQWNEHVFRQDCYTYHPPGMVRTHIFCDHGALALMFFDSEPHWTRGVPDAGRYDLSLTVDHLDAFEMSWSHAGMDPFYGDSGSRWKLLRGRPGEAFVTNLISSPAHRHPPGWSGPQERHDCSEEMFLISGEYLSNVGIMRPGAYFWRPPGIAHGPYGTRSPTLALIRTLGAPLKNNWTAHEVQISRDPPLAPRLPAELQSVAPGAWQAPSF